MSQGSEAGAVPVRAGEGQSRSVLPVLTSAFDYSAVPSAQAVALRQQAKRIRERIRATTISVIEVGRDLLATKQNLPHGLFIPWVEAECGVTIRTAQLYMTAAAFAEGKSEMVSRLTPTALYRLAAKTTPAEVVTTVIQKLNSGAVVAEQEVITAIAEARAQKNVLRKRSSKKARPQAREAQRQKHQRDAAAAVSDIINAIGKKPAERVSKILGSLSRLVILEVVKHLSRRQRGAKAID